MLQSTIEAILFAVGDAIEVVRLALVADAPLEQVELALQDLTNRYDFEQRGMMLVRTEDGNKSRVQMVSRPVHADAVRRALESRRTPALSAAALEVLTIVAYRQPCTRAFIEQLRGVDSAGTVAGLLEKGMLAEAGRLDVIGRPILLCTTDAFLRAFSLTSLADLPPLPDMLDQEQLSLTEVNEEGHA